MKKKVCLLILSLTLALFTAIGFIGCKGDKSNDGRVDPHIVVDIDQTEISLPIYTQYRVPYAGVYYKNLDRVDGIDVYMSLIDSNGQYMYEETMDMDVVDFFFAGEYKLVYSAKGCKDVVITIYVCDILYTPEGFSVQDGTLTWTEVFGASGYKVTVNGESETIVTSTSFTSDIFDGQGYYVGVTAIGDGKVWLDSSMGSYESRIPLKEYEIAAFDNPCYELDIVEATPNTFNAPPYDIEYLSQSECLGSNGGAVKLSIISGEYGTGLFRLKLQDAVVANDSETLDGIEVRFKLESNSYIWQDSETATRFILGQPEADERRVGRGTYVYADYDGCWQTMQIPFSAIDDFDELDYLQFSLFNMTRSGGTGTLYLDYIRYYKGTLSAPSDLAISGTNLTFSAVEGAGEYMVSVDKIDNNQSELVRNYFYTNTNSIALSEIGIDPQLDTQQYEIQVRATSAGNYKGSSPFSQKLTKRVVLSDDELAPLDSAIYFIDVNQSVVDSGEKTFEHMWYKAYEQTSGADGNYAMRMSLAAESTYGTYSAFSIDLQRPLDLENSGYDSVVLRFKVESSNYASNNTLGIQLAGSTSSDQNYKSYAFRDIVTIGEWSYYRVSMEELKQYYATGDTRLSFVFANPVANVEGGSVYIKVALDWLRYFNSIEAPTNVRVVESERKLKWDAVANASGYVVSVNDERINVGTATEYDISSITNATTFKVRALSGNPNEIASSAFSNEAYYEVLKQGQLLSFNHKGYEQKFTAGNPDIESDDIEDGWRSGTAYAPTFESLNSGDAVVKINPLASDVGDKKVFIFTINFDSALSLVDGEYNAIEMRFLVDWISQNEASKAYLALMHATDATHSSYTTQVTSASRTAIEVVQGDSDDEMQTFTLTFESIKALGYAEDTDTLTFGIWVPTVSAGSAATWIDDVSYTYYSKLDAPSNVRIQGTNLVWDEVDDATGYIVSVDGVEKEPVATNSYSLADIDDIVMLKVRAITSNEEIDDSDFSSIVYYEIMETDQIATFNHAGYIDNIVTGNPNLSLSGSIRSITYEVRDDTDGVVALTLQGLTSGMTSGTSHVFTITLPALDLTNKQGISIVFQIYGTSNATANTMFKFMVLHATTLGEDYTAGVSTAGIEAQKGETGTLFVSAQQLLALGYVDGATTLTLSAWSNGSTLPSTGGSIWVWLDEIRYSEAPQILDTPSNVRIQGTNLVWDEVAGASGYVVLINGVEQSTITTTSYDISTLSETSVLAVRALSESQDVLSSPYSANVTYEVVVEGDLTLINFNSADDITKVVAGNPNVLDASTLPASKFRDSGGTEHNGSIGDGGAAGFAIRGETTSWMPAGTRSHIITLNFGKALDLTNNAGIVVKFLVEWHSNPPSGGVAVTEMKFLALNADTVDDSYKRGTADAYTIVTEDSNKTNFQEFRITAEQLIALGYSEESTYLTLSVYANGDTNPGGTGAVKLWLDDVSYYNE